MRYKLTWKAKIGLILFLAVVLLICAGMAAKSEIDVEYSLYCVKPGDTLWSIAKQCPGDDIRKTVWLIQKKNDMEQSAIYPGDLLYIPVTVE